MSDEVKPLLDDKKKCPAKDIAESLKNLIDKTSEHGKKQIKVALFSHKVPDPDALGSQLGMNWLLNKAFGIESDLYYEGEISHPQNIAICNLLDPQLKHVKDFKPSEYQLNILLDTIPNNAGITQRNMELVPKIDFDVVIDHHKELPNGGFCGLCIHMKTGACCSIVYKLMKCLCKDNWFEDDNDADSKVATAMIAGILTDTENMVSDDSTEFEFEAYTGLFPFRNSNFLKQIVFFKRTKFWIDAKANGAKTAEIDDEGYAIVGLGSIPDKDRDLISDMADEMSTWANVTTAIAFAIVGGDRIEGSVRSLNASMSVSDLCKKLAGRYGNGGGKLGKGAYKYGLAGMSIDPDEDEESRQEFWKMVRLKESKRINRLIRK